MDVPVRGEGKWAAGHLRSWAETFPRVHFHIFLFFASFLFSAFLFPL
jgi:hypothetical protein